MGLLLEGKVIAVIGGNGLIGRETVAAIVDHGGEVVVASRSEEGISEILEKLFAEKRKQVVNATVDVNSPLSKDTLFTLGFNIFQDRFKVLDGKPQIK